MSVENEAASLYQHLDLDSEKRHFVFGDIHGRFSTFRRLLDRIDYDSNTDVIYSVGDLIDRGPDSVSVVEFFQNEHCHNILGNHEYMAMSPARWHDVWMYPDNGGPATLRSLMQYGHDLPWLTEKFNGLPACLDVGDESHPHAFRLLHAECPFDLSEEMLKKYLSELTWEELSESDLLWGRTDISLVYETVMNGGSMGGVPIASDRSSRSVFCGHTPIEDVVSAHNVHWIDTYAGNNMTCMNPITLEVHQVSIHTADT